MKSISQSTKKMLIAIQPDDYTSAATPHLRDSSSPIWKRLAEEAGHSVRLVDVTRADILTQLSDCSAFMWRWAHFGGMGRIARRLLPVVEKQLGLHVYPDQSTCWHYDDKIAQAYLLSALRIPTPETWIWFDRDRAMTWAKEAEYPFVLKLSAGAGSTNVRLVETAAEATSWIDRVFSHRLRTLDSSQFETHSFIASIRSAASILKHGRIPCATDDGFEVQVGYALCQRFLSGNSFDTRVTIVGKRAFAFRRFNRPNDFRASGSGAFDTNPLNIDLDFIRLAFKTAEALKAQCCAIDGLYAGSDPVVAEVSYTFASWAIAQCPGHWQLEGNSDTGNLRWIVGTMWPEEAQMDEFLRKISDQTVIS